MERKVESVGLAARRAELSAAVSSGSAVDAGRLYGLPEPPPGSDCWVDIAGATALTGVAPKTISSWLVRGGPVRNPFPGPRRILYRLYWPIAEIKSWQARENSIADDERVASRPPRR
jgi:hypothetical protein